MNLVFFIIDFNLQHWIYWEWSFVIFYFFMKLSWSHNSGRGFNMLTMADLSFFFVFILLIFLFHLSILSWLKNELHNFFYLLFMRLSWYHDLDYGFSRLIHVDLGRFYAFFISYFFQLCPSTLGWLKINLHSLFWLSFYRVIMISWSES